MAGRDRALDRRACRKEVAARGERARFELPADDFEAGDGARAPGSARAPVVAAEREQRAAEVFDRRRGSGAGLGRALEAGKGMLVLPRLEVTVRGAEHVFDRRGSLAFNVEAGLRADLEVLEGLRRVDREGSLGRLGLRQALIGAVALQAGVYEIRHDMLLGRLAPREAHPGGLAAHFHRGHALRRLQEVVDGELLALGVVQRDVVAAERERERGLARGLDLRRAVGRERELELVGAVDIDHLLRARGRSEDVEPVVGVDREAVERFIAAPGAERALPLARRREHLDHLAVGVGDVEVARRVRGDRDRTPHAARLVTRAGVEDLVHEDAVAREDLHAVVAGVGDIEVVGEDHVADLRELAVARAELADAEALRAVVAVDLDAAALRDRDVARVEGRALGPVETAGKRDLDLSRRVEPHHAAIARVEAQHLAREEGIGALAIDAQAFGAAHARQPLDLGAGRGRFRDAEKLDLAVADVRNREVAARHGERGHLRELATAFPGAAEAPAHLAALPVDLGDVAVAGVGDEHAAG